MNPYPHPRRRYCLACGSPDNQFFNARSYLCTHCQKIPWSMLESICCPHCQRRKNTSEFPDHRFICRDCY